MLKESQKTGGWYTSRNSTSIKEVALKTTGQYKITANGGLNLRSAAQKSSAQLAKIPLNTSISVTEVVRGDTNNSSTGWGKTSYGGKTGWISLDCATRTGDIPKAVVTPGAPTSIALSSTTLTKGQALAVTWSGASNSPKDYVVNLVCTTNPLNNQSATTTTTAASFKLNAVGTYKVTVASRNTSANPSTSAAKESVGITVKNPYTVTFTDADGKALSVISNVEHGKGVTAPSAPTREGYTFQGWDKAFSSITGDTTIKATYKINTYTVSFVDEDEKLIGSSQKVNWSSAATPPTPPPPPTGHIFAGWNSEDYKSVKQDLTIKTVYVWENAELPIIATINSAQRTTDGEGYNVSIRLLNYPEKATKARAIVTLKTNADKMVASETESFTLAKSASATREVFVSYERPIASVEVNIVGIAEDDQTGVPLAEAKTFPVALGSNEWSSWSTTYPTGKANIEQRTEYRSANKEYTTSTDASLSGWTQYGSSTKTYGSWGGKQYTTVKPTTSETLQITNTTTTYNYFHYCNKTGSKWEQDSVKAGTSSVYHSYSTTTALPKFSMGDRGGKQAYGGKSSGAKACAYGFYAWFLGSTTTTYEYQTRSVTVTYNYWKWSNTWTDWSPTAISNTNGDKNIQTRTTYRYKDNLPSTSEDTTGSKNTISGTVDKKFSGKRATLMIYKGKNTDPTASQLEYVAQGTIDSSGKYSFSVYTKEVPSAKSGDFVVLLGIEGATSPMYVDTMAAPKASYTVRFLDSNGKVLKTQKVSEGASASLPTSIPTKAGYSFANWSTGITNIHTDLDIVAQYKINSYTVVFVDWLRNTLDLRTFQHGGQLLVPAVADKEGNKFLGWDARLNGTKTVTNNMVVVAKYEKQKYRVSFLDANGAVFNMQMVEYGSNATVPSAKPTKSGMVFDSWDTSKNDYRNVQSDVNIPAKFIYPQTVAAPKTSVKSGSYTGEQTVVLTSSTVGAKIYYTLSDSTTENLNNPGSASFMGIPYTAPISIPASATLASRAFSTGMNPSAIDISEYTISPATVKVKVKKVSLATTPPIYLQKGKIATLRAAVQPYNATDKKLTYKSLNPKVVSVDKNTGKMTALKTGKARIIVTSNDGKKQAGCSVIVVAKATKIKTLKAFKPVGLKVGETIQIKAKVTPAKATGVIPVYSSSNKAVARIDKAGVITALKKGITTITVKAGNKTQKFKVTVGGVLPTKITLNKTSASINVEATTQLKVKWTPTNVSPKTVTWKSGDKSIATVDSKGKVKGIKKGKATITATTWNGLTVKCTVTVI